MIAVDSSVIVAAVSAWHEHHDRAAAALEKAMGSVEGIVVPAHAILEAYAVLTRLPAPHRVAAADAETLLHNNFATTKLAGFPSRSIWKVIKGLSADNLGGGIAYDAAILAAAEDAGATSLLTLNGRDFERLAPRIRIVAP
jgi:predicted nucleic acid-binding protein